MYKLQFKKYKNKQSQNKQVLNIKKKKTVSIIKILKHVNNNTKSIKEARINKNDGCTLINLIKIILT